MKMMGRTSNRLNSASIHIMILSLTMALFALGARPARAAEPKPPAPTIILPDVSLGDSSPTSRTLLAAIFTEQSPMKILPPGAKHHKGWLLPKIIFLLYDDGTMIWSKNVVEGGGPLFMARTTNRKAQETIQQLKSKGYFHNTGLNTPKFGPEASTTTLYVHGGAEGTLYMESWHELVEQNPKLIATSRGIESLNRRDRKTVLSKDTQEYQDYRHAWSAVKQALLGLAPKEAGTPAENVRVVGKRRIPNS